MNTHPVSISGAITIRACVRIKDHAFGHIGVLGIAYVGVLAAVITADQDLTAVRTATGLEPRITRQRDFVAQDLDAATGGRAAAGTDQP